jgi:hypothetical protein
VTRRRERERLLEVRVAALRVDRECALPREPEEAARSVLERLRLDAGGPRERERLAVVVREQLGVVLHPLPRDPLDPTRRRLVLARARRPRDLGVGDVAHEPMAECELRLALDRREPCRAHELAPHQLVEAVADGALFVAPDGRDGAGPEHLADDGRVLEERLAFGAERVEPRRDQRLDGLRDRGVAAGRALAQHADELFGVERVSAGALQKLLLRLGGQHRALEECGEKPSGVLARERRE